MQVRHASVVDADVVTEIISRSFLTDPVWSWAFPDDDRRYEQFLRWWRPAIDVAIDYGWVFVTNDESAAAVWLPPGADEYGPGGRDAMIALLDDLLGDRAALTLEGVDLFEAQAAPADCFYLSLLGTVPERQGQGLGLGLLADTLARVDAEHAQAYLESTNPGNDARYRRTGFVDHGTFAMPAGGPPVLGMLRPARQPFSSSL
jgi:GNAT superfamily N-acetyltransferase